MEGSAEGCLERVNAHSVSGWLAPQNGSPGEVTVLMNGARIARFRARGFRADATGDPQGAVGFEFQLPRQIGLGDVVSATDAAGRHLRNSPYGVAKGSRQDKALWLISRDMKILEIGPSYNPLVPRSRGWNSFTLDHASEDELRLKYGSVQRVDRIEHVDYIWNAGDLEAAVPAGEHGSFDAIVASHVIEHVPDPIGWFASLSKLLKPEGYVALAIPDKRTMFDFFNPLTRTSDYLCAHYLKRRRHSRQTAFDNIAGGVQEDGNYTWSLRPVGDFRFRFGNSLMEAARIFESAIEDESAPYVDYHATFYTPSSFALIVLELHQMGLLPFKVECAFPTSGCEFFVTLRRESPSRLDVATLDRERLRLMAAVVRETGEQSLCLVNRSRSQFIS